MKKKFEKFVNELDKIRTEAFECIETLINELGTNNKVILPEEIDEYLCPEISYMGGNHPEHASNVFERIESISLVDDDVVIHFSEGFIQDLYENNLDDILFVMQILLTIKELQTAKE